MKNYTDYIETNPKILVGKPIIKGTRISVGLILNFVANGHDTEEIIKAYPHLTKKQIQAALTYAANHFEHEEEYHYST